VAQNRKGISMVKKSETLAEAIQRKIEQQNRKAVKNFELYAKACLSQGKKVGEPIDILSLLGK